MNKIRAIKLESSVPANGLNAIAKERTEQIKKHGFNAEHDDQHLNDELSEAATYCLTEDPNDFPTEWDLKWMKQIHSKPYRERLAIAGALIAAEIDRIDRDNTKPEYQHKNFQ